MTLICAREHLEKAKRIVSPGVGMAGVDLLFSLPISFW
jgi:hypothetical protein